MRLTCTSIMTRIEWCRQQRAQARTQSELERWRAEEEGLRDAFLNRDHTNYYRFSPPDLFWRYAMGLEDGRALVRLAMTERHVAAGFLDDARACDRSDEAGDCR